MIPRHDARRPALPQGYLRQGYFDNAGNLRPEVITDLAEEVARILGSTRPAMASTQLRRFYNKARFAKQKLDSGLTWERVIADIHSLRRDAANAVGRETAPQVFADFININARLAAQTRDSFVRGFLEHFQSVLAFRKYQELGSFRN